MSFGRSGGNGEIIFNATFNIDANGFRELLDTDRLFRQFRAQSSVVIDTDSSGNVYAANTNNDTIDKFSNTGKFFKLWLCKQFKNTYSEISLPMMTHIHSCAEAL